MTKIINLYGGPGTGKSTAAADLFQQMKKKGYKVELVTEYAKDMVYEGRHNILQDQVYIFAKQNRRISRLVGKVDYVITDSPILLGLVYADQSSPIYLNFKNMVIQFYRQYDNLDFFLLRAKEYQRYGRNQTLEEAKDIDKKIARLLDIITDDVKVILCNEDAATILKEIIDGN